MAITSNMTSAVQEYVYVQSSGAVTEPTGGSWIAAYCLYLGVTTPSNGSWLQALCEYRGITSPSNGSWVQALAESYGITLPLNGSWWMALADGAAPALGCEWGQATATFGQDTRLWSATTSCTIPPAGPENWEAAAANWEAEADNWETI